MFQRTLQSAAIDVLKRVGGAALLTLSATNTVIASDPGFEITPYHFDAERPTRPHGQPYTGPIVDTHVHLLRGLKNTSLSDVADEVAAAGVSRLIVLPTPNEGRMRHAEKNADHRRKWVKRHGVMAGRLCGSTYFTLWMHQTHEHGFDSEDLDRRINRLRQDLQQGGCLAIGEIGPYHFDKKQGMHILITPLDYEPMLRLVDLAVEQDTWLDVHIEPRTPHGEGYEAQAFGGIAQWFKRQPNLKLILAHTAMTNPENARALLKAHPNLMMNMKQVNPRRRIEWDHLGRVSNIRDEFYEDWAKLFEEFPDRIMIGTDGRFGDRWFQKGRYQQMITAMRKALGSLTPEAAEKIAHLNALRVFGAPTASSIPTPTPTPTPTPESNSDQLPDWLK